jgi:hypothetical protein
MNLQDSESNTGEGSGDPMPGVSRVEALEKPTLADRIES